MVLHEVRTRWLASCYYGWNPAEYRGHFWLQRVMVRAECTNLGQGSLVLASCTSCKLLGRLTGRADGSNVRRPGFVGACLPAQGVRLGNSKLESKSNYTSLSDDDSADDVRRKAAGGADGDGGDEGGQSVLLLGNLRQETSFSRASCAHDLAALPVQCLCSHQQLIRHLNGKYPY